MSWEIMLLLIFGLILVFIFLGTPVAGALGVVAILTSYFFLGRAGLVAYAPWHVCNSFILTAIPLFVFMGEVLCRTQLGARIYDGSTALVGRVPGTLLHANIVSCAIFAAVSGSSMATAATIGSLSIPELKKRGYDISMIVGSLAGGGTLGILIPPSIIMIVYCVLTEESIGSLFIAGILPGIMLSLIFMVYIYLRVKMRPSLAPPYEKIPWKRVLSRVIGMWPIGIIVFTIIGGIYLGVMTPTESAGVAASMALILSLLYRTMTWSILQKCLLNAVKISTMMMFIVIGASILAGALSAMRVPDELASWIISLEVSPLVLLILLYFTYLIMGCFFDGLSMMILTLPIVFPMIVSLGFDPIWFGVALVILIEMAQITPPVGFNLYVLHGLVPERPISMVIKACLPFLCCMIVGLAIITAFPIIATWLPSTMRHG